MKLFESEEILEQTSSIIHEDTQLHDQHLDLTVAEVHQLSEAGTLDFGGSEFTKAGTEPIDPDKRNPNDDYG